MMIYLILSVPKLISFRSIGCETATYTEFLHNHKRSPFSVKSMAIEDNGTLPFLGIKILCLDTANINQDLCKTYNTDLLY